MTRVKLSGLVAQALVEDEVGRGRRSVILVGHGLERLVAQREPRVRMVNLGEVECLIAELPLWVGNGLSLIPKADANRNSRFRGAPSAGVGQDKSFDLASHVEGRMSAAE